MHSDPSRVYDSRSSSGGRGFPSCETGLCRRPVNRKDPSGYYAEIGVDPGASDDEIKSRLRTLYRELHPDTGTDPDVDRLVRVHRIGEVLTDPIRRERYNQTPPGKRLLDAVYRSELSVFDFAGMDRKDMEKMLRPVSVSPPTKGYYDYLSVDRRPGDRRLAQRWYEALVSAAPAVGYRGRIKVLLHDGPAWFHPGTSVMAIPRWWTPSTGLAFALYVVVAEQRHPGWGRASAADVV